MHRKIHGVAAPTVLLLPYDQYLVVQMGARSHLPLSGVELR